MDNGGLHGGSSATSTPQHAMHSSGGGAGHLHHHLLSNLSVLTMNTASREGSVAPSLGSSPMHAHFLGPPPTSVSAPGAAPPGRLATAVGALEPAATAGSAVLSMIDLPVTQPAAAGSALEGRSASGTPAPPARGGPPSQLSTAASLLATHLSGSGAHPPGSPSFRQHRQAFFIGVAGGTASGKTTVRTRVGRGQGVCGGWGGGRDWSAKAGRAESQGHGANTALSCRRFPAAALVLQVCDKIMNRLHDQNVVMLSQVRALRAHLLRAQADDYDRGRAGVLHLFGHLNGPRPEPSY